MPNQRAKGTVFIALPMPMALKKELRILAERDSRPLTAYIRLHLGELVRRSKAAKKTAALAP